MTHHLTLKTLIMDFVAKQSGGITATERLAMVSSAAIAYATPLPNCGTHASGETYDTVASAVVSAFISDVNEAVYIDHERATSLAKALYLQRYEVCYCPALAFDAMSPLETLQCVFDGEANATGVDAKQTMAIWAGRFIEAAQIYVKEFNKE